MKNCSQTELATGEIVLKTDPRIEALGTVDELVSMLGVARQDVMKNPRNDSRILALIRTVQIRLFSVGSMISSTSYKNIPYPISAKDLQALDAIINERGFKLMSFAISGDSAPSAFLDVCRALARRLERQAFLCRPLDEGSQEGYNSLLEWLNKLSTVLWIVARYLEDFYEDSKTLEDYQRKEYSYGF